MTTLKNVLLLNGLSSGVTGIGLIVFAPAVADLFAVSQTQAFYGTGIFLLLFGANVAYVSRKSVIQAKEVLFITALDFLWVLTSAAIVLLGLFDLSLIGYLLIGAVAAWVATMAYLQSKGMKQLTT